MVRKFLIPQLWALGLLLLLSGRPGLAQERAYLLGIISYGNSAQMIASEYHGLTAYLSRVLKKPVRVEWAREFSTLGERATTIRD